MGRRYIVCLNERQATKDRLTREAIIKALKEKIPRGPRLWSATRATAVMSSLKRTVRRSIWKK